MKHLVYKRSLICVGAILFSLASGGCYETVQTTSGQAYLKAYPQNGQFGGVPPVDINRRVAEVAAVEPLLRFPARIGLVRVVDGQMTPIPQAEADAWFKLKDQLGSGFGEFVPVNLLVAHMVSPFREKPSAAKQENRLRQVIETIRLGAARQHLDAVFIYELYTEADQSWTNLNIADWTIIGAYLFPSQKIRISAYASGLLLDVRNGYPYGTVNASAKKRIFSATANVDNSRKTLAIAERLRAVEKLIPEVHTMMDQLRQKLPSRSLPGPEAAPQRPVVQPL